MNKGVLNLGQDRVSIDGVCLLNDEVGVMQHKDMDRDGVFYTLTVLVPCPTPQGLSVPSGLRFGFSLTRLPSVIVRCRYFEVNPVIGSPRMLRKNEREPASLHRMESHDKMRHCAEKVS